MNNFWKEQAILSLEYAFPCQKSFKIILNHRASNDFNSSTVQAKVNVQSALSFYGKMYRQSSIKIGHVSNKNLFYALLRMTAFSDHLSDKHRLCIGSNIQFLVKSQLDTISVSYSAVKDIIPLDIALSFFYRFSTQKWYNLFPLKTKQNKKNLLLFYIRRNMFLVALKKKKCY